MTCTCRKADCAWCGEWSDHGRDPRYLRGAGIIIAAVPGVLVIAAVLVWWLL